MFALVFFLRKKKPSQQKRKRLIQLFVGSVIIECDIDNFEEL